MATVLLLLISGPWPLFLPWNRPKRGGGGQFPQLTEQLWVSAILWAGLVLKTQPMEENSTGADLVLKSPGASLTMRFSKLFTSRCRTQPVLSLPPWLHSYAHLPPGPMEQCRSLHSLLPGSAQSCQWPHPWTEGPGPESQKAHLRRAWVKGAESEPPAGGKGCFWSEQTLKADRRQFGPGEGGTLPPGVWL